MSETDKGVIGGALLAVACAVVGLMIATVYRGCHEAKKAMADRQYWALQECDQECRVYGSRVKKATAEECECQPVVIQATPKPTASPCSQWDSRCYWDAYPYTYTYKFDNNVITPKTYPQTDPPDLIIQNGETFTIK